MRSERGNRDPGPAGQGCVTLEQQSLIKALQWLDRCQIRENPKYFGVSNRHRTKGAWPFSTKEQGYTVSDCTGEGLKSVLYLQNQLE